jgi:hypothetical protein
MIGVRPVCEGDGTPLLWSIARTQILAQTMEEAAQREVALFR